MEMRIIRFGFHYQVVVQTVLENLNTMKRGSEK